MSWSSGLPVTPPEDGFIHSDHFANKPFLNSFLMSCLKKLKKKTPAVDADWSRRLMGDLNK